jgi:inner membrane protein
MDSLTQLTLGAAVGELVLGNKVGRKAAIWGGFVGTLPDLDVLADPFLNEIQALSFHRGISHSLVFTVLASPVLGWMISRIHRSSQVTWRAWSQLVFWCLLTHITLDCFTTYGTQIFQPFSDYRVIVGSIFIIDPLYTIPLLTGLVVALWVKRTSQLHRVANYLGIGLSSLYLLLTFANKLYVEEMFKDALQAQGYDYQQLFTYPTAFNNLLWIGLAANSEGVWVGHYSLFDAKPDINFRYVLRHGELLDKLADDPVVQRLRWFSNELYTVSEKGGVLYFNDLHLPRTDNWLTMEGDYIFSFRLIHDPEAPQQLLDVVQERPPYRITEAMWQRFARRVLGVTPAQAAADE